MDSETPFLDHRVDRTPYWVLWLLAGLTVVASGVLARAAWLAGATVRNDGIPKVHVEVPSFSPPTKQGILDSAQDAAQSAIKTEVEKQTNAAIDNASQAAQDATQQAINDRIRSQR